MGKVKKTLNPCNALKTNHIRKLRVGTQALKVFLKATRGIQCAAKSQNCYCKWKNDAPGFSQPELRTVFGSSAIGFGLIPHVSSGATGIFSSGTFYIYKA